MNHEDYLNWLDSPEGKSYENKRMIAGEKAKLMFAKPMWAYPKVLKSRLSVVKPGSGDELYEEIFDYFMEKL